LVSIVASILLFSFAQAGSLDPTYMTKGPLTLEVAKYFCVGDFKSVAREGANVHSISPAYFSTQVVMLSTKEGLSASLSKLDKLSGNLKSLSSEDRLVIVSALLQSKSRDEKMMQDLLSFTPANAVVGAYQKVLEGDFLLVKYPEVALRNYIDAFNELPYLDSSLLSKIFQMAMRDKNADLILKPFLSYIEQLPEEAPDKYVLMAYREFLASNLKNKDLAFSYVKRAYELCRYDQDIALFHASNLIYEKNNDEAEEVLLDQVKIYPNHSPSADLFLAKIYAAKNNKSEAAKYAKMAEVNKTWLVPSAVAELEHLDLNEDIFSAERIFVGLSFLFGIAIVAWWILMRRKEKEA
jgi:hypothetical protein